MSPLPVLYSFRRCPYAMRARLALSSSSQHCALREVVLRDKPAEMLAASPKGTVPVLVTPHGDVIDESLDVMIWALEKNDPEDWLLPLRSLQTETMTLIQENDGPFKAHLDRYKYTSRYEGAEMEIHRNGGLAFCKTLNDRLMSQPYLSGSVFSLTDAAIAPFIRQFANTDRAWFDTTGLTALQTWLDLFLASDRFTNIMAKFPKWESGDQEPVFPA